MSYHRSDYARNKPYAQSKYSDYKPSYFDRDYGNESNNLLVQISGPARDFRADPRYDTPKRILWATNRVIWIFSTIAKACFQCAGLLDANKQLRLILGAFFANCATKINGLTISIRYKSKRRLRTPCTRAPGDKSKLRQKATS
jgi:hypothetical protein